jgi:hypothetical protein
MRARTDTAAERPKIAIFQCKTGDWYAGEYKGNRMRAGFGVHQAVLPFGTPGAFSSGYRGAFSGNQREGHGVEHFANGGRYHGQWSQGRKEGSGVFTYPSGERIFGRWERGTKVSSPLPLRAAAYCMPRGMVYVRGTKVSSVLFDAVNAEHAAVLRNADEAEARHVAN